MQNFAPTMNSIGMKKSKTKSCCPLVEMFEWKLSSAQHSQNIWSQWCTSDENIFLPLSKFFKGNLKQSQSDKVTSVPDYPCSVLSTKKTHFYIKRVTMMTPIYLLRRYCFSICQWNFKGKMLIILFTLCQDWKKCQQCQPGHKSAPCRLPEILRPTLLCPCAPWALRDL